jgi:hypothetical protein
MKINFFHQKLQFIHLLAYTKGVQATREAFEPQKRTSSTSKRAVYVFATVQHEVLNRYRLSLMKFRHSFLFLWAIFA